VPFKGGKAMPMLCESEAIFSSLFPGTAGVASIPANPYPYLMPIKKTALIMIDFQRDFMEVCSFAESLGNDVSLLQVRKLLSLILLSFEHDMNCDCLG
jgi:hypothetical protein